MEDKRRTIVLGDIHGCIDEFDEMIKKLSYNKDSDRLILAGDLIDRGPDSVAVVARAREMDLECVMGNHDYKFMKWFRSSGSRNDVYDKRAHYTQLSDQDIAYISRMSDYIELDTAIVVHAGLKPGIPLSKQRKDDLFYLRYTDANRKFISLKQINKVGKEELGAVFWTEFGPFGKDVVFGHNVFSYEDPFIHRFDDGTACYGIDTGCCFGGRLTALIVETKELVQVQAKQVYYKSDFDIR